MISGRRIVSLLSVLLLLGAGSALSGCSQALLQPLQSRHLNLTESSYAATDMLVQQANAYVTPATPIEVGTLKDLAYPMAKAPLGRVIPEQVGARLVQLGYNVTSIPSAMLKPNESPKGAMIGGHYALMRKDVAVHLQITDKATSKVLAAYDYTLPYTQDLRMLMGFQVPEEQKSVQTPASPKEAKKSAATLF